MKFFEDNNKFFKGERKGHGSCMRQRCIHGGEVNGFGLSDMSLFIF